MTSVYKGDLEYARSLLVIAGEHLKAIKGMKDIQAFADEIFGFHAQQTVEKALKAWLNLAGVEYPRTYNLKELLTLLEEHQETIPKRFYPLMNLTDFAIRFRYEPCEEAGKALDRLEISRQVAELVEHVKKRIKDVEATG